MKKVLSLILAVCMLASFAMVASAAPSGIVLDVVEGETTVTATITVKGDMTNVNVIQAIVTYNPEKVTLASNDIAANLATRFPEGWADNSAQKKATASLVTYMAKASESKGNTANYLPAGTDFAFATLTFDKVAGADVEAGDIVIVEKNSFKPNIYTETYVSGSQNKLAAAAITNNFTNYVDVVVVDPAVTTESADVAIVVDEVVDGTANYTATAAAKFGKKATLYANGEVIVSGTEYAATEATVITVEYVDDDAATVYAAAKVYSAAGEGAVFAKATNGATDCGFIIEAFQYKNFNNGTYMNDAKFAAANVVDGVFGILLTNVAAGTYEAVPYAGADLGAAVNLVVE